MDRALSSGWPRHREEPDLAATEARPEPTEEPTPLNRPDLRAPQRKSAPRPKRSQTRRTPARKEGAESPLDIGRHSGHYPRGGAGGSHPAIGHNKLKRPAPPHVVVPSRQRVPIVEGLKQWMQQQRELKAGRPRHARSQRRVLAATASAGGATPSPNPGESALVQGAVFGLRGSTGNVSSPDTVASPARNSPLEACGPGDVNHCNQQTKEIWP